MYFKILKEELTHHGFTYKEGLNEDTKPFDSMPTCEGGLFFADEKNIMAFCHYGDKIAEVTVPEGAQIVDVAGILGNKYKAHKIILGKIRKLWSVNTFKWLVKCGADIHASDDWVLRYATQKGHVDIVKFLIEAGANIHVDENYALRYASYYGYADIVSLLIKNGVNIHASDDCALRYAAENGHTDVVQILIEAGAEINTVND